MAADDTSANQQQSAPASAANHLEPRAEAWKVDTSASLEEYELRTAEAVCEYLRDSPDLVSVLEELPGQTRSRFGSETRLALEVCPDYEGDEPPLLYAHVVTMLSAEDAWDRLLLLEQEWWLDATESMSVNLHVEFA